MLYMRLTLCCALLFGVLLVAWLPSPFTSFIFLHDDGQDVKTTAWMMGRDLPTTDRSFARRNTLLQHQADSHIIVHDWLAHTKTERQAAVQQSAHLTLGDICALMPVYRPSAQCRDLDRLGELGDGGKWVCGMHEPLDHQRVVYSFGSNYQVSGTYL